MPTADFRIKAGTVRSAVPRRRSPARTAQRAVQASQRDSDAKPNGCAARAALGHRPTAIPTATRLRPIVPVRAPGLATTPLALVPFPPHTQGRRWRANLGLEVAIPSGFNNSAASQKLSAPFVRGRDIALRCPVAGRSVRRRRGVAPQRGADGEAHRSYQIKNPPQMCLKTLCGQRNLEFLEQDRPQKLRPT